MTARTFTTVSVYAVKGTRKGAQAEADRLNSYPAARGFDGYKSTAHVEHTGPRMFTVIRTEVQVSEPSTVRHIMGGDLIQCRNCNGHQWYYTGRTLYSLNYECADCGNTVSPPSETGASQ